MHVHVLENPCAGRGRGRAFIDAVTHTLRRNGHETTTYRGGEPGDLARHVATLGRDDLDVLVLAGGDGTLRSVVNATDEPPPWPVGLLPVGTANVVAREAGMQPRYSPARVAEAMVAADPWSVDLLEVRRGDGEPVERAVLCVSAGADAEVVRAVGETRSSSPGSGGYGRWVAQAFDVLLDYRFRDVEASLDGGPMRAAAMVVVQNAYSYGGYFTLSPRARLDSGQLEVVWVHANTTRDLIRLLAQAGLQRMHYDKQVKIERGTHVKIRANHRAAVQADGDPAGTTDIEIRLLPNAMKLLKAPKTASIFGGARLFPG